MFRKGLPMSYPQCPATARTNKVWSTHHNSFTNKRVNLSHDFLLRRAAMLNSSGDTGDMGNDRQWEFDAGNSQRAQRPTARKATVISDV